MPLAGRTAWGGHWQPERRRGSGGQGSVLGDRGVGEKRLAWGEKAGLGKGRGRGHLEEGQV